jgi:Mrp family chromosome partitioning ATPase
LVRAFRRQALVVLCVAVGVGMAGVAGEVFLGSASWQLAALFWGPVGVGLALLVGIVRELGRNTVTTLSSFGKHRGYAVLGAAPELTPGVLRQLPPDKRSPLGCVAFWPASAFATAFRDLQGSLPERGVVAVVGSIAGEGATTAALCAAASAAQQGKSVIVVDCDLRLRSLTQWLMDEPLAGVLEASEDPANWRASVAEEHETGVHFMPAVRSRNAWQTLANRIRPLIEQLRENYDLVVLDCPPALESAEGLVLARLADRAVVVTAWDRTPLRAVRRTVQGLHGHSRRTPTAVYVNRVPAGFRFGRIRSE